MLLDDFHHVNVIDEKVAVINPELVLRKIKSLIDKINVLVLHSKNNCNLNVRHK